MTERTCCGLPLDAQGRCQQRTHRDPTQQVAEALRGDGPCATCGTDDNIVWFTDNVFWNRVVREPDPDAMDKILCIPCFVTLVDQRGYRPTGWRLTPEWRWDLLPFLERPLHVMSCGDCRGDLDAAGHFPDCPRLLERGP